MEIAQDASESWSVVIDDATCVSTSGLKSLSELQDSEFIDCNSESHARLIAAAPELLQALEMFVRWEESGTPTSNICFAHARAAIAKAKGRFQ